MSSQCSRGCHPAPSEAKESQPGGREVIDPGASHRKIVTQDLEMEPDWLAWPAMHGGYVMAAAARAAAALAGELPLRVMSTRLIRAIQPGSVVATALLESVSRTTATVSVRLVQNGQLAAMSTATFAAPGGDLHFAGRTAPAVPAPNRLEAFRDAELLYPFARHVEIRPATRILPFSNSAEAEFTAWLQLRAKPADLSALLVLADAMPPAIYAVMDVPIPVPSVEITIHLATPLDGDLDSADWLLAQQRNVVTGDGLSIDECDLWAADGRLLGQTRQLRRVLQSSPAFSESS